MRIFVQRINDDAQLPSHGSEDSTGFDLRSTEEYRLQPGEWKGIGTGLKMAPYAHPQLPPFDIQIRPRSGLAFKHGITVLNSPGTIDEDYRGEVKVILINHGSEPFDIAVGDRIAQVVVAPYLKHIVFEEVENLDETERGEGGFGSTGVQ